ncbi:MAG: sigma 54-interacting transcriptional regulator [Polyangiaceae bacterium]
MSTTQEKPRPVRRRPAESPGLTLVYSGDEVLVPPRRIAVSGGATPIGREARDGIHLDRDGRASRLHATLHTGAGGTLHIVDEKSRNGTFVNGERTAEALLAEGDVLTIGDSLLVVRSEPRDLADSVIPGLVGSAPSMRALRGTIGRVAPSPATVLVVAESGCGKEVVARAIHDLGRPGGPFVAVNCSAIPETLAESTLFGHLAGSFSGAVARTGLFRAAHGGTLFLDEVGELPLAIQPKLLRVLQDRIVVPVGATSGSPCDVRVVAATNRDMAGAVEAREFRGDLYARLSELCLDIVPLRERREDVLWLLVHALGAGAPSLSPPLAEALVLHHWPFNVREVLALAAHLRVHAAGAGVLDLDHASGKLPLRREQGAPSRSGDAAKSPDLSKAGPGAAGAPAPGAAARAASSQRRAIDLTEAEIRGALKESDHEIGTAARILGVPRPSLYRAMEQLGIRSASDLSVQEIEAAHAASGGDVRVSAASLQVSEKALLRRLRELRLVPR